MRYRFTSKDHPAADGKTPPLGAVDWKVQLPLEGGALLILRLGQKSRDTLRQLLDEEAADFQEPLKNEGGRA